MASTGVPLVRADPLRTLTVQPQRKEKASPAEKLGDEAVVKSRGGALCSGTKVFSSGRLGYENSKPR